MDDITGEQHEDILRNLWKQTRINKAYQYVDLLAVLLAILLAISFTGALLSMIIKM